MHTFVMIEAKACGQHKDGQIEVGPLLIQFSYFLKDFFFLLILLNWFLFLGQIFWQIYHCIQSFAFRLHIGWEICCVGRFYFVLRPAIIQVYLQFIWISNSTRTYQIQTRERVFKNYSLFITFHLQNCCIFLRILLPRSLWIS